MKKIILLFAALISLNAIAKNSGGEDTDGHVITCKDLYTQSQVLKFSSLEQQSIVETSDFTLSVKTLGDDVAQMILLDRKSQAIVEANRTEEVLTVSFNTGQSPAATAQSFTNQGLAKVAIKANSGDQVEVVSLSRKSVSKMQINLSTAQFPTAGISIICEKSN